MYSESPWRNHAAPIIRRVLSENADQPPKVAKKALRDAYPFGQRKYHPYKIWLDEIARQTGRKGKLGARRDRHGAFVKKYEEPDPRQEGLFA